MNIATARFQALSHETRLRAFRFIIFAGKAGRTAGVIAGELGVPASTLSSHLAILERAGLIQSWRVHRSIHYAVTESGIREIMEYLTHDCCSGVPELCGFPSRDDKVSEKVREKA